LIPKETIDRIFEAARIEEVIGDFVQLKKSGSNYKGLSPFTNEKTPSFMVSPAKQIFKDFSSGKGGSVVTFLMELEQYTYPEALRYLAKRYNIEIEEKELSAEERRVAGIRESLLLVNKFAAEWFGEQLHKTEPGRAIGLTYFKERGFNADTIERFQLGYSPENWEAFSKVAVEKGYRKEFLTELGLGIENERAEGGLIDRFRGRVMFPIHDISGRVVGFGGRILNGDSKAAKYLNSPESQIYHKSKFVFGLYFAKQEIVKRDECLLVEGYTDVLSLHQLGFKHAVASSGTALTTEQIRAIHRYTPNLTILFDSDPAGIKASFRGIDMILEAGMNVRVVQFPEGEDPDSFARKHSEVEFAEYLENNRVDFIRFKAQVLGREASEDPILKSRLIVEIVQTIAKIPDRIAREVYVKETSRIFEMDEAVLHTELNRIIAKNTRDAQRQNSRTEGSEPWSVVPTPEPAVQAPSRDVHLNDFEQERAIVSLLLNFGNELIREEVDGAWEEYQVAPEVFEELREDGFALSHPVLREIYEHIEQAVMNGRSWSTQDFTHHANAEVAQWAIELTFEKYELANWSLREIVVPSPRDRVEKDLDKTLLLFKRKRVVQRIHELMSDLKKSDLSDSDRQRIMEEHQKFTVLKRAIDSQMGRVV